MEDYFWGMGGDRALEVRGDRNLQLANESEDEILRNQTVEQATKTFVKHCLTPTIRFLLDIICFIY
jgi:hypothetical protein